MKLVQYLKKWFEILNILIFSVINNQTSAVIRNYIKDYIKDKEDEEKVLTQSCETKVNRTLDMLESCDECKGNICAQVPE